MEKHLNHFLSKKFRADNNCEYNKDKFKEYLEKRSNKELETIYQIFQNTHDSYRMSHDKFQSIRIGTAITFVISLISLLISLNIYTILAGSLIIFISITIFIFFAKKLKSSKKEANNLKEKKKCITDEIIDRIDNKVWKN